MSADNGWKPWSSAPKDGTVVLALIRYMGADCYALIHWRERGGTCRGWCDGTNLLDRLPHHWMPLPAAPDPTPALNSSGAMV